MEAYTTDERLEEQAWSAGIKETLKVKKQKARKAVIPLNRDIGQDAINDPQLLFPCPCQS